jgi:hypothetical protein
MDEGSTNTTNGNGLEEEQNDSNNTGNNGEEDADSGTNEGDDDHYHVGTKDKAEKNGQRGKERKKNIKKMHFAVEM